MQPISQTSVVEHNDFTNKSALDHHLMDIDGVYTRKPYTREDFKVIINKTFLEYYGKFKDQFNPEEYL